MKVVTIVNVSSKLLSSIAILVFINEPRHFLWVPIINSVGGIIPGLVSLMYIRQLYNLQLKSPQLGVMISQLKKGSVIFLTSVSGSLYSVSNTFMLGILFSNTYAGYYSFAEKIIRSCTALFVPLNNALFPFMAVKMQESQGEAVRIFIAVLKIFSALTFLGSVMLFFSSDLLRFIIPPDFYPSIAVLKTLAPLLVFVGVSNLIGFQILYTVGKEKKFLAIILAAGIINLSLCYWLSFQIEYQAAAVSLLVSEMFICICFLVFVRKMLWGNR